jgi:hypothetical protein
VSNSMQDKEECVWSLPLTFPLDWSPYPQCPSGQCQVPAWPK